MLLQYIQKILALPKAAESKIIYKTQAITYQHFTLVTFMVGFCFFWYLDQGLLFDNDAAWHIETGNFILKLGHIPKTDNFYNFTSNTNTWYNYSWLYDIIISALKKSGGMGALLFLKCSLFALIISVVQLHLSSYQVTPRVQILVLVLLALVLSTRASIRPECISLLLLVVFHLVLNRFLHSGSKWIYSLPFLTAIWCNMHGYFSAGIMIIFLYAFVSLERSRNTQFWQLFSTGIACLMATCVSPEGYNTLINLYHFFDTQALSAIHEFKPLTLFKIAPYAAYFFTFLFAWNIRQTNISLHERVLVITWLFLGFSMQRSFLVFTILAAPAFALGLQQYKLPNGNEITNRINALPKKIIFLGFAFFMFSTFLVMHAKLKNDTNNGISPSILAMHDFINTHYANKNILNTYNEAGKLMYLSQGNYKLFIDGRLNTVYSEQLLVDYFNITSRGDGWLTSLKRYPIDLIVTFDDTLFAQLLPSNGYKKVNQIGNYVFFEPTKKQQ